LTYFARNWEMLLPHLSRHDVTFLCLSVLQLYRCTPLLLANVCVGCMMAQDEEHLSKDEKQKRINKTVYMQSVIIDLLTTPSL